VSIRVAIVEDDRLFRESLARFIEDTPGFSSAGTCTTAEEAWRVLPPLQPEVVLMDINLPGHNGITCLFRLRPLLPKAQVIMLTIEEDSERVFASLKAGATGYLVKHAAPQQILAAIQEVRNGGAPMSGHIARMVIGEFRQEVPAAPLGGNLSPREEAVLRLLAKGHRSKEIGDELGIGTGTVNTHVRHIYEKLHVRSRAEAVARLGGSV
jgi:DNA-binding NarL/FixJ family response regulator